MAWDVVGNLMAWYDTATKTLSNKSFADSNIPYNATGGYRLNITQDGVAANDTVAMALWNTSASVVTPGGIQLGANINGAGTGVNAFLHAVDTGGTYVKNLAVWNLEYGSMELYGYLQLGGTNKITGLADGESDDEAVNKGQLDAVTGWDNIPDRPAFVAASDTANNAANSIRATTVQNGVGGDSGYKWGALVGNALYTHPETAEFSPIPHVFNDIAYNCLRGSGTVEIEKNSSTHTADGTHSHELFSPDATFITLPVEAQATDEYVITVTLHRAFYFGTKIGIQMTDWCRAQKVTMEQFDGTSWSEAGYLGADYESVNGLTWSPGSGGATGITKIRFTLSDFLFENYVRITQIMLLGFDSAMVSGPFVPRGGGDIYGPISYYAAPADQYQLANKGYVDAATTASGVTPTGQLEIPSTGAIMTLPRNALARLYDYDNIYSEYLCLTYVYPGNDVTIDTIGIPVRDAATGTPTLTRIGIYSVDAPGNLTLIGSTPNDTALLTTGYTTRTKTLSAPVNLVAGNTYAFGLLIVTTGDIPGLWGMVCPSSEAAIVPRLTGYVDGVTDLPASVDYWDSWDQQAAIYMRAWEA